MSLKSNKMEKLENSITNELIMYYNCVNVIDLYVF